jgi:hypothetical protein
MFQLTNKKYKYCIAIFLIVTSFIAYGLIFNNGFVNFDYEAYIIRNQQIRE